MSIKDELKQMENNLRGIRMKNGEGNGYNFREGQRKARAREAKLKAQNLKKKDTQ